MTDETESPQEEQSETVDIPLTACPDCKPGDSLTLKVLSVDEKSGTISAKVEEGNEPEEGGSDAMAAELGNSGGQ